MRPCEYAWKFRGNEAIVWPAAWLFEEALVFREVNGLWGLIVLAADIWAIVNILQSGTTTGKKVLWTVIVLVLPVLGFIIWFFAGPKSRK